MDDVAGMGFALAEAQASYDAGGVPVGAALVGHDGSVVGVGHNRRVQDANPLSHGETQCMMNVGRRASYADLVMYTTLAPCMMCAGTIVQFGIPRVVVGEAANFPGELDFLRARGVNVVVLDHKPCIELMAKFIAEKPELWNEDIGVAPDA
ncbi:cytosine deaminase [Thecamonas trahens ATCC 50062]|uniref:Cytosine deaminase n=1 Tax=Thecamonas trahens ATCC 50062 TaxID=461836 RepID=A0A0L0DD87_THETB|nr:cytosine deaminase [Thecamonas trahens ATCC 50062]KNC50175.1 cytosine deaminase [Thecamonas trahens ATCC 50062]|eukprot:XP_013757013.1 cytosine deaminase [Thecamonas trahens ATCC 50062]